MSFEDTVNILESYRFQGIAKCITKYKDIFELHNVRWENEPLCGANGCMFDTYDPDWIIKVTYDPSEVHLFQILDELDINEGFAKIDEIYPVAYKFCILVKERVIHLNDDNKELDYEIFMHSYYQNINVYRKKQQSLERAFERIKKNIFKEVEELYIGLKKLALGGYYVQDISLNNVGLNKEGNLTVFDAQMYEIKPYSWA